MKDVDKSKKFCH